MADVHLLVVQKHAIDGTDGSIGRLSSLVVNKAISLGAALFVGSHFAGQDIAEGSKGIMQSLCKSRNQGVPRPKIEQQPYLVVDLFIEILDENVALAGLAQGRVTLGPHDAAKSW